MKAKVHYIQSNDIPGWPNWTPSQPSEELQWFTVEVGPEGEGGADLFQVAVATPQGLRERRHKLPFVGLVVNRFEPSKVERAIEEFVADCEAVNWPSIVDLLRTKMLWEYEPKSDAARI